MDESFTITSLSLPGVLLITPQIRRDERGFSGMVYASKKFAAHGIPAFVEEFASHSKKHVLRGLHLQRAPHAQDKLVRCTKGEIFDVAADVDLASPTYGRSVSANLKSEDESMLFIPGKYAHGFCVVSDEAVVEYKLSDTFHPESVGGARYDDTVLAITWPIINPIISKQDASWPSLLRHEKRT